MWKLGRCVRRRGGRGEKKRKEDEKEKKMVKMKRRKWRRRRRRTNYVIAFLYRSCVCNVLKNIAPQKTTLFRKG
jgi:hypothetical protein